MIYFIKNIIYSKSIFGLFSLAFFLQSYIFSLTQTNLHITLFLVSITKFCFKIIFVGEISHNTVIFQTKYAFFIEY